MTAATDETSCHQRHASITKRSDRIITCFLGRASNILRQKRWFSALFIASDLQKDLVCYILWYETQCLTKFLSHRDVQKRQFLDHHYMKFADQCNMRANKVCAEISYLSWGHSPHSNIATMTKDLWPSRCKCCPSLSSLRCSNTSLAARWTLTPSMAS